MDTPKPIYFTKADKSFINMATEEEIKYLINLPHVKPMVAVKNYPHFIRFIINPTTNVYFEALKNNAFCLEYIPKEAQTEAMCKYAFDEDIDCLGYCLIDNPIFYEKAALECSRKVRTYILEYIPEKYLSSMIEKDILRIENFFESSMDIDLSFISKKLRDRQDLSSFSSLSLNLLYKQINVIDPSKYPQINLSVVGEYLRSQSHYKTDAELILSGMNHE